MKTYARSFLYGACLLYFSIPLSAQGKFWQRHNVDITMPMYYSFHRNAPVNTYTCFEGCFATRQVGQYWAAIDVTLLRQLDDRHAVSVMLGLFPYTFLEDGMANTGGGTFIPYYAQLVHITAPQLGFGHRYALSSKNKLPVYWTNQLILENTLQLIPAYQTAIGTRLLLTKNFALRGSAFYKTTLGKSRNDGTGEYKYLPYAYGIRIGVGWGQN